MALSVSLASAPPSAAPDQVFANRRGRLLPLLRAEKREDDADVVDSAEATEAVSSASWPLPVSVACTELSPSSVSNLAICIAARAFFLPRRDVAPFTAGDVAILVAKMAPPC